MRILSMEQGIKTDTVPIEIRSADSPFDTFLVAAAVELHGKRGLEMLRSGVRDGLEGARALASAARQKTVGRNGGGPECPNCGERRLKRIENSATGRLYECHECRSHCLVYVGRNERQDGLVVEAIAR